MSLFEEIKMLIDLVDDGYITEKEFDKLVDKKKKEKDEMDSKKLQEQLELDKKLNAVRDLVELGEESFNSIYKEFKKAVDETSRSQQCESFDFVDQESAIPYSDDKDDFDIWKERNKIDEDKKFNRYVYKGNVYWMEAGSQGELELIQKICQEKFTPSQLVEYPSSPHAPNQPFVTTPYLGGGWGSGSSHPHPMWWNDGIGHGGPSVTSSGCVSVDALKGTIQSSENNE